MKLVHGIKLSQLSVSCVDQKLIINDIIWNNGMIEQDDSIIDFEIVPSSSFRVSMTITAHLYSL